MLIREAVEMIEKLSGFAEESLYIKFAHTGTYKAYHKQVGYMTINSFESITTQDSECIYIPALQDESLYGEWLDRMIRAKFMGQVVPYKDYPVSRYIQPQGYDTYSCPGTLVLNRLDDILEQWYVTDEGIYCDLFVKREIGGYTECTADTQFAPYITCPGDFYLNPRNSPISHYGNFQPSRGAYSGQDLYYDPKGYPDMVLIRVGESWLWVDYKSFSTQVPSAYIEEWTLCQSLLRN